MKISVLYNALALTLLVGSAYIGAVVTSSSDKEGPTITNIVTGPHPTPNITGEVTGPHAQPGISAVVGGSAPTTALGGKLGDTNTFIDRTALVTFNAPFNLFQFKAMTHSDNPTVGYFALHIPFFASNKEQTDENLILAGTIKPAVSTPTSGTYYLYVHKDDLSNVVNPETLSAAAADLQPALAELRAVNPSGFHGHLPVLRPGIKGTTPGTSYLPVTESGSVA